MKTRCFLIALSALTSFSVEAGDTGLIGAWSVQNDIGATRLYFYSDSNFAIEKKRSKSPIVDREEGGYIFSEGACSTTRGNEIVAKGNLWIRYGRTKCCYKAYFLGDILALDIVESGLLDFSCPDRTLKQVKS